MALALLTNKYTFSICILYRDPNQSNRLIYFGFITPWKIKQWASKSYLLH